MPLSDDDIPLIRNALFAYGIANADTPQGMRAQELYRLLGDVKEFGFAQEQQPRNVSRCLRARDAERLIQPVPTRAGRLRLR
jgi:hypothetical protein